MGDEVAGKKGAKRRKEKNLSQNADTEGPSRLCTSAECSCMSAKCSADIKSRIFGQIVADNKII